jgi:thioredoxin reductase
MRSVVIIGAGPAGLTAARALAAAGLRDVLVLEREQDAGGVPRHCGHPGFGMVDFKRFLTGPAYARRLADAAAGAEIRTGVSVLRLAAGGSLEVSGPNGIEALQARAVLIATGTRETPRSARLVSGSRPSGVLTTGALQQMVYLAGLKPFERPVIVGSELVSFSAILTCRHRGIRPVAMLEEGRRITARRPGDLLARWLFGVRVLTSTRLDEIIGLERVEAVRLVRGGREELIACDGVIFTGRFVPEAALLQASHLLLDPATGGPAIDNFWRCSDPSFFAAGNVVRPVEHAGMVSREGRAAAEAILQALDGKLPPPDTAAFVKPAGALRYIYPQRLLPPLRPGLPLRLHARALSERHGRLRVHGDGVLLAERRLHALPERRITIELAADRIVGKRVLDARLD